MAPKMRWRVMLLILLARMPRATPLTSRLLYRVVHRVHSTVTGLILRGATVPEIRPWDSSTRRWGSSTPRDSLPMTAEAEFDDADAEDLEEGDMEGEGDKEEGAHDDTGGGVSEGSLRLKVRQHVNPLSSRYQLPVPLDPEWIQKTFPLPKQPILIDVGCAKGTWALKYAKAHPHHNILGLEIRRPVVEFALRRKQAWNLSNVYFLATNANVDIMRILGDLKERRVEVVMVTIHHPDPHFKNKHKKRRVVTDEFVAQLVSMLPRGTALFVQSDVLDCCEDMVATIASNPSFAVEQGHSVSDIAANPAPTTIKTEREVATIAKGLPVYRCMFRRV